MIALCLHQGPTRGLLRNRGSRGKPREAGGRLQGTQLGGSFPQMSAGRGGRRLGREGSSVRAREGCKGRRTQGSRCKSCSRWCALTAVTRCVRVCVWLCGACTSLCEGWNFELLQKIVLHECVFVTHPIVYHARMPAVWSIVEAEADCCLG